VRHDYEEFVGRSENVYAYTFDSNYYTVVKIERQWQEGVCNTTVLSLASPTNG